MGSTGGGPAVLSIDPEIEACDPPNGAPSHVPEGKDDQVRVSPDWLLQVTGVKPLPHAHRKSPANGTRRIALTKGLPSLKEGVVAVASERVARGDVRRAVNNVGGSGALPPVGAAGVDPVSAEVRGDFLIP